MSESLTPNDDRRQEYLQYRAISMSAVITLMLGIMALPAVLLPNLLVLPCFGLLVGAYSWMKVHRRRDELIGLNMARIGFVLCAISLLTGSSYAGYVYATEVPEGYARIDFGQLQPDPRYPQFPIPPSAMEMNGKQVFVKGYIHPGLDRRKNIQQFILVPDMKTCCFGGQPKLTDMIQVTLADPLRIDYSFARRRLAGTLKVTPYKKPVSGLDGVYYQLEADYVK